MYECKVLSNEAVWMVMFDESGEAARRVCERKRREEGGGGKIFRVIRSTNHDREGARS